MLYVKESSGLSQLVPTFKFRDWIPDGGWIIIDLPQGWVLEIIQEEVYREVAGQFSWTTALPVPVTKPRFFLTPMHNFWNIDYFYINEGRKADTVKLSQISTTLNVKSTPASTENARFFVFTIGILGLK